MLKCDKGCVPKFITTTTFGHGDSSHICYAECQICGRKSSTYSDWGLFKDDTLRKAQKDFNNDSN